MPILDLFRLDGRVALVTGASRGLGKAAALALAGAGADIVGLSQSPQGSTLAEEVTALDRRCHIIQLDLGTATVDDLKWVVQQVVDHMGRLDILINNAGIIRRTPAIDYSEADWDAIIQIDLKVVFFLSQAAACVMKAQGGGKIINVASLLSFQGGILVPAYSAAKHGVAGLTRALANEWAAKNINVNAVVPGYMETDVTTALRADSARNSGILSRIPAGRWGKPDDLQGAVLFLASDAAAYVHGTMIEVDGGWMAR